MKAILVYKKSYVDSTENMEGTINDGITFHRILENDNAETFKMSASLMEF